MNYINDLPKNTVNRCTFKYLDDLCLVADRDLSDLISQHNGGGKWLVLFSTSEIKRVMFHHNRADQKFAPIRMNGHTLNEARCFERLKLTPNLKGKSYILTIAKDVGIVVVYYCITLIKYVTPADMLYLYKS